MTAPDGRTGTPDANVDRAELRRRYGPWAVVTGGSEGVGAAFALQLAEAGVHLVLAARRAGPLEETAGKCRSAGATVRTVSADLTSEAGVAAVLEATKDIEVGLLVLNAGANTHGRPFLDGDLDAFNAVIDLNVTSSLALVHPLGRLMRDRGRGGIMFIGSLSGGHGAARQSVYGGSKAFLQVFGESLWLELRGTGVDVLVFVLGLTRTPAMERAGLRFDLPEIPWSHPDDVARQGLAALPHGPVAIVDGFDENFARAADPDRRDVVLKAAERMAKMFAS
ncbi:SDR family NAD(P)-dependent oxidoreductase [Spirillospora sp. NPDC052242]